MSEALWRYNCIDVVRTREVGEASLSNLEKMGLQEVDAFQQKMFWPVLDAMIRGVRVDLKLRQNLADEIMQEISERERWFASVLGHALNPASPKQMQALFYSDLGQREIRKPSKNGVPGGLTLDDKALRTISVREPLLRPLIRKIMEYRSLGVFLSTFITMPLDVDQRVRCSYNICGTETYRLSSSENAFGSGGNLQNVPKGGEMDEDSDLILPNVREMFVPDPGYIMFDKDLSKADLRIVVWESGETEMKKMLAEGADPYIEVAKEFYRDPTIRKKNPDGSENAKYKLFKAFCHGTHYLGSAHGLSQRIGLTVHEAEKTQRWYFGKFPRIQKWQERVKNQLRSKRYVENAFGYRRYYFDRIDDAVFREGIAWIPQSTVGLYINKIWLNLYENHKHIQVLLQVHDSLVGQFPIHRKEECLAQLEAASQIIIPYEDPLIIPTGTKFSDKSWGDCE